MARKKSGRAKVGGPKKRITARQKAARRKNIEIARRHIRRRGGGKKPSASSRAKKAFAKEYKRQKSDRFISKAYARNQAFKAAMKASKQAGRRMARRYAMGVAKSQFKIRSKKGRRDFAGGFVNALIREML